MTIWFLPETILKEAFLLRLKQNDSEWANVVKGQCGSHGRSRRVCVNSKNVEKMRAKLKSPVVRRLVGYRRGFGIQD